MIVFRRPSGVGYRSYPGCHRYADVPVISARVTCRAAVQLMSPTRRSAAVLDALGVRLAVSSGPAGFVALVDSPRGPVELR